MTMSDLPAWMQMFMGLGMLTGGLIALGLVIAIGSNLSEFAGQVREWRSWKTAAEGHKMRADELEAELAVLRESGPYRAPEPSPNGGTDT